MALAILTAAELSIRSKSCNVLFIAMQSDVLHEWMQMMQNQHHIKSYMYNLNIIIYIFYMFCPSIWQADKTLHRLLHGFQTRGELMPGSDLAPWPSISGAASASASTASLNWWWLKNILMPSCLYHEFTCLLVFSCKFPHFCKGLFSLSWFQAKTGKVELDSWLKDPDCVFETTFKIL